MVDVPAEKEPARINSLSWRKVGEDVDLTGVYQFSSASVGIITKFQHIKTAILVRPHF
jgi:hypothetical protein